LGNFRTKFFDLFDVVFGVDLVDVLVVDVVVHGVQSGVVGLARAFRYALVVSGLRVGPKGSNFVLDPITTFSHLNTIVGKIFGSALQYTPVPSCKRPLISNAK